MAGCYRLRAGGLSLEEADELRGGSSKVAATRCALRASAAFSPRPAGCLRARWSPSPDWHGPWPPALPPIRSTRPTPPVMLSSPICPHTSRPTIPSNPPVPRSTTTRDSIRCGRGSDLIRRRLGLRPPHVNLSEYRARATERCEEATGAVRVGLDKVKKLSRRGAGDILEQRTGGAVPLSEGPPATGPAEQSRDCGPDFVRCL